MHPTNSQRVSNGTVRDHETASAGAEVHGASRPRSRRWFFADACFDEAAHSLTRGQRTVSTERRPIELLRILLLHAGEVMTKAELLDAVWPGRVVVEAVLSNAVTKLRRALNDHEQTLIATVHGVGYKLTGKVRWEWVEHSAEPLPVLAIGDALPARPHWRLVQPLSALRRRQTWLTRHDKTGQERVFKFALDPTALPTLRREVTLSRLLQQTLGEHPGLVPVLDWNFDRTPYFIETQAAGLDLLRWSQARGGLSDVPLTQRLGIASELAGILADAHSAGVLHKDIKPANVLIDERTAGLTTVRLADFGSGDVLDPELLRNLRTTHAEQTPPPFEAPSGSTPLYIAPELLQGEPPTTASDVYALGIVIYQLIAGDLQRPMTGGWERYVPDELLRDDLALATQGDPLLRLSSAREFAQRLDSLPQRRVELKQRLEAERAARQAAQLLERQRARRPWRIAAGLAMGLGLLFSSYFSWQANRAREAAVSEVARSSALVHFLRQDLLAAANPRISGSAGLRFSDAVEAAAPMIEQRFVEQPEIAAELHATVAEVFHQLSDFAAAEQAWRNTLNDLQRTPTAAPKARAQAWFGLSQTLARQSRIDEAESALQAGLAELPDNEPIARLKAAQASAVLSFARSDDVEAERVLRQALAEAPSSAPVEQVEDLRLSLGEVLARRGRYEESQALLTAAVERLGTQLGPRHPRTLGARHALGRALQLARQESRLQRHYESLVEDMYAVYGKDSEYTTLAEQGLANVYYKLQQWDRQLPLAERVLAQQHQRFGTRSLQTLGAAIAYSAGLLAVGRAPDAAAILETYLPDARTAYGAQHLVVFVAELNQVAALLGSQQESQAAQLLATLETRLPEYCLHDPDCKGELALQRGRVLAWRGHRYEARKALQDAVTQLSLHNAEDFWTLRLARETLASL